MGIKELSTQEQFDIFEETLRNEYRDRSALNVFPRWNNDYSILHNRLVSREWNATQAYGGKIRDHRLQLGIALLALGDSQTPRRPYFVKRSVECLDMELVGYFLTRFRSQDGEMEYGLDSIHVLPWFQTNGYSNILIAEMQERLKSYGMKSLRVACSNRSFGNKLLEKGWTKDGVDKHNEPILRKELG